MKKITGNILFLVGFILSVSLAHAEVVAPAPHGLWRTYDLDNHARSIVKIISSGSTLTGVIQQVLSPQTRDAVCSACTGALHNKKLVGLPIIWGLKKSNNEWVDGRVLNVDDGKVYHCHLRVAQNNKVLYFSAYLGMPFLGKTLNWMRVR